VDAYDRDVPFARSGQYEFHRETIALRRALGSATAAIADGRFTLLLHATLQKWGIGRRASRLVPLDVFRAQLREYAAHIADLQEASLERGPIDAGTIERIDHLVRTLTVVENKAKIVACTKTLHHLLPDLVPPMDRAWTGAFFGWSTVDPQNNQREILDETLHAFARIARETRPSQFVGKGWRTSLTKVLDNALIGYCMIKGIGGATA
jgi:hypothetical protein